MNGGSGTATMLPRSFLYVPGNKPELFGKAATGPADALVLDLEDAVPLAEKEPARQAVGDWLDDAAPSGVECWVRVDADAVAEDLDAVVAPGLSGVFLAKCSVAGLAEVAATLDALEEVRGLAPGAVGVVGLVESAAALLELSQMARVRRVRSFGIGEVDLIADLRMARGPRSAAALEAVRLQVVLHCAAAGLAAPVAPTSTDFRDLDGFAESTRDLQALGFRSRTAVHPSQVPVIHEVLTPDAEAVAAARDVLRRFEAAAGGVTTDERGRLVDAAVVRAAQETLSRAPRH